MDLARTLVAETAPRPALTGLTTPEGQTQIAFAAKTWKFHQGTVFDEFELPFGNRLGEGSFILLSRAIVCRYFCFPEAFLAYFYIFIFGALEILIMHDFHFTLRAFDTSWVIEAFLFSYYFSSCLIFNGLSGFSEAFYIWAKIYLNRTPTKSMRVWWNRHCPPDLRRLRSENIGWYSYFTYTIPKLF
jgi:hypothetical protein